LLTVAFIAYEGHGPHTRKPVQILLLKANTHAEMRMEGSVKSTKNDHRPTSSLTFKPQQKLPSGQTLRVGNKWGLDIGLHGLGGRSQILEQTCYRLPGRPGLKHVEDHHAFCGLPGNLGEGWGKVWRWGEQIQVLGVQWTHELAQERKGC
jgi:hypothetical protein